MVPRLGEPKVQSGCVPVELPKPIAGVPEPWSFHARTVCFGDDERLCTWKLPWVPLVLTVSSKSYVELSPPTPALAVWL